MLIEKPTDQERAIDYESPNIYERSLYQEAV